MGSMYFKVLERNGEPVDAAKNAPIKIHPGELSLIFDNVSDVKHEAHFGRKPVKEEGKFDGYEENLFFPFLEVYAQPGQKNVKVELQVTEDMVGE